MRGYQEGRDANLIFLLPLLLDNSYTEEELSTENLISIIEGRHGVLLPSDQLEMIINFRGNCLVSSPNIFIKLLCSITEENNMELFHKLMSISKRYINLPIRLGKTALYYAIKNNNIKWATLLLDNNAFIGINSTINFDALSPEMKEILKERQSDIEFVDQQGDTNLTLAIKNNDHAKVVDLLEKGANVNHHLRNSG